VNAVVTLAEVSIGALITISNIPEDSDDGLHEVLASNGDRPLNAKKLTDGGEVWVGQ
jgi:hypothetical protein